MFTGIIQTKAQVVSAHKTSGVLRLVVNVDQKYIDKLAHGASIAINGCCLTVCEFDQTGNIAFDVIDETLKLTNLGALKTGCLVNFERSMTFGSELGGHIVSGHIHTVATLSEIIKTKDNCKIKLALTEQWRQYVLYKGFICVNGASLTVGELDHEGFWLHLIPETLAITTLGTAKVGDLINIEVDQQTYTIVNTVQTYLAQQH